MSDGVRCPNPKCGAKLAEALEGRLVVTCRKCGQTFTITRPTVADEKRSAA